MTEPTSTPEPTINRPMYAVPVVALDAIGLYLSERPYGEVAHLMQMLNGVQRIKMEVTAGPTT
jgi:hypothetical protein